MWNRRGARSGWDESSAGRGTEWCMGWMEAGIGLGKEWDRSQEGGCGGRKARTWHGTGVVWETGWD